MEKIILKPNSYELLYKNGEANTHYDILVYGGTSTLERTLGTLYVIAHIKYNEEDLSYVISLITSVAKREYYSEQSLQEQNPKAAFERTLRKLNEILEDFFETKDIKLNIGLAVIAGDLMYISHLGRFKLGLARENDYIDILNNLATSKSDDANQKFSNIVSGRIKANDKIFAYYPTKSFTATREKSLNSALIKDDGTVFQDKIAGLASSTNNFACCGVHITVDQVKETPIIPPSTNTGIRLASIEKTTAPIATATAAKAVAETIDNPLPQPYKPSPRPQITEQPKIIAADMAIGKRSSVMGRLANTYRQYARFNAMNTKKKLIASSVVLLVIAIPVAAIVFFTTGPSSEIKNAYKQAGDKVSQAKTATNEREARTLLMGAISQVAGIDNQKAIAVGQEAETQLDVMDKVSDQHPTVAFNYETKEDLKLKLIAATGKGPLVLTEAGNIGLPDNAEITGQTEIGITNYLFGTKTGVVAYDANANLAIYDPVTTKISKYTLKNAKVAQAATLYEGNLYLSSETTVYKYTDAATGSVTPTIWGQLESTPLSIAVDGNLYALTSDGLIGIYYKGKKTGALTLPILPSDKSYISVVTGQDSIFLIDPVAKRIYTINKSSGSIMTTYKLNEIDEVKNVAVADNGTFYIASSNKVWELQP